MSIRLIALELYKIMKRVEELERKLQILPPDEREERSRLEEELRRAKAEEQRIRKVLDGAKSG